MATPLWLVLALAAFDLLIVALVFISLRAYPPTNRRALIATGIGLSGFVFHAFLFFDGAVLILQLATIAGILGLCWLQHRGLLVSRKERRRIDQV